MAKNSVKKIVKISAFLAGFLATTSAFPHHSFVGEFDTSQEFELLGTVTKVEWFNPHVWIYLDGGKTVDGNVAAKKAWQCEMGSPNMLLRAGWRKENLPEGTVIRVTGNPARDGSNTCNARFVTMDDANRTPVFSRGGSN